MYFKSIRKLFQSIVCLIGGTKDGHGWATVAHMMRNSGVSNLKKTTIVRPLGTMALAGMLFLAKKLLWIMRYISESLPLIQLKATFLPLSALNVAAKVE